jgi:hypothetical protein
MEAIVMSAVTVNLGIAKCTELTPGCKEDNMKLRFIGMAGLWTAVLAMVTALPAQDDHKPRFGAFEAAGYQASSSAPFVFEGKPIGHHAVWTCKSVPWTAVSSPPFRAMPPLAGRRAGPSTARPF